MTQVNFKAQGELLDWIRGEQARRGLGGIGSTARVLLDELRAAGGNASAGKITCPLCGGEGQTKQMLGGYYGNVRCEPCEGSGVLEVASVD